ncbi:1-phosphatidylinositol 4,5-bisphosphate phosphodiesterase zeta-1 [Gastrophryne carolinensis]
MAAFTSLRITMDAAHAKALFKAGDPGRSGHVSGATFKSIYRSFVQRRELLELFQKYSSPGHVLTPDKLLEFLRKEQQEGESATRRVTEVLHRHELNPQARSRGCLTFEGFTRFMNSADNHILRRDRARVYQDMRRPISDYYISSSHNTYLLSDQLVGQSHLWAYQSALMRGCRCVEIDCWDGDNGEPIVYHGFTLTAKIPFKSVIYVIEHFAFKASQYPLVLSLEDHCCRQQQEVLANDLIDILGNKLLSAPIGGDWPPVVLPSPEDLKYKILIKHKKCEPGKGPAASDSPSGQTSSSAPRGETSSSAPRGETSSSTSRGETSSPTTRGETSSSTFRRETSSPTPSEEILIPTPSAQAQEEEQSGESSDETAEEEKPRKRRFTFKLKFLRSRKYLGSKKQVVAPEMSDLVIYTKSRRFLSFQLSRETQKCYENNSLSEHVARRLARQSAQEFIHHTRRFLTRIYPKGARTTSSNYHPVEFWNVGCQMVALNFQTPGLAMDLQDGKFRDNGGCGYVLKPECLRAADSTFHPYQLQELRLPIILTVKVISGFLLPPGSLAAPDPMVTVEIFGAECDQCSKQTQAKKKESFNPQWNEAMTFAVRAPELALLRFSVADRMPVIPNALLGQYTLPLSAASAGYRHVPLLNRFGQSLLPASLFVHIAFQ